ncbi:hypothetical protein SB724_21275, partial [Bacillus sp. SIMBA_031]
MPQDHTAQVTATEALESEELVPPAEPHAAHETKDVETQADLSAEIKAIGARYAEAIKNGKAPETMPRLDYA